MVNRSRIAELFQHRPDSNSDAFRASFARQLEYNVGSYAHDVTGADLYHALARTVRDILIDRWNRTQERYRETRARRVYYLSLEFLIGNMARTSLLNLGVEEQARRLCQELGLDLTRLLEYEPDAGLGNGGLGRLAACFLDSMATLGVPSAGQGLRYEYGMFHQQIVDGWQKETPDNWLARGNPWELRRSQRFPVQFYGYVGRAPEDGTPPGAEGMPGAGVAENAGFDQTTVRWNGTAHVEAISARPLARDRWFPGQTVAAAPYDVFVPGYGGETVNHLRLWSAESASDFGLEYFNHGDYIQAVKDQVESAFITKVLYPNDSVDQGKELRLKQEYFLVSASIQDAFKTLLDEGEPPERLPERAVFQLNDTHPALAVAELVRVYVDDYDFDPNDAFELSARCLAYTNHTILPEAMETWDAELMARLLPRHLQIIYELNHRFLEDLRKRGADEDRIRRMSIVDESQGKRVRMANLAIVGSRSVNGVAALHTKILREHTFRDFHAVWPEKFSNKTNGIAHRRWLLSANPELADAITARIGAGWIRDLEGLRDLEAFAEDDEFQAEWRRIKGLNKERLAQIVRFETGCAIDPQSIFDVHIKRIHEYKRQHLNALRLAAEYLRLKEDPSSPADAPPRTYLFAGKAAPGYARAKIIIKLITSIAETINADPQTNDRLRAVFMPDYRVSLAERIYPASDLSVQISTAGMEASGTGNMKFMLNGALTLGTLDGANIEIQEEAGAGNCYIFGHTVEDLDGLRSTGYRPEEIYAEHAWIRAALDAVREGRFSSEGPELFQEIVQSVLDPADRYFVLADLPPLLETSEQTGRDYADERAWTARSIRNAARAGKFSSDRTIREYDRDIWGALASVQTPAG